MQIRLCPKCHTERPLSEMLCGGEVNGAPCDWDLTGVAITEQGVEPPIAPELPGIDVPQNDTCPNGHPVDAGDLICPVCSADLDVAPTSGVDPEVPILDPQITEKELAARTALNETTSDDWVLCSDISVPDTVRERYIIKNKENEHQAIFTLYCKGAEPDTAIYDVLRRMPLDHLPEIIETGRSNGRAYEITEYISGGNFDEYELDPNDLTKIRRIVDEIGRALYDFSKAGLRHRDLRPHAVLIRTHEPLDLVIDGFGSAQLSEYDLDIVSPLETTKYMAPEAIAGGISIASDWWSLGMLLLEKVTGGSVFDGVNKEAFLINALTNGVFIPDDVHSDVSLLLRGLLVRDRQKRWQWDEVSRWLKGESVEAPEQVSIEEDPNAPVIYLGDIGYRRISAYTLAAAQEVNWNSANDQLQRGEIISWAEEVDADKKALSGLRNLNRMGLDDDFKLSVALKILNTDMPLIHRGNIVTPGWLLENPLLGYKLISSEIPDMLSHLETELWLSELSNRIHAVLARAKNHEVELNEETLRVNLLSTSKARLSALWDEMRKLYPDTNHSGLAAIIDRQQVTDEDLIILLSASSSQFRSTDEVVKEAAEIAQDLDISAFDNEVIIKLLHQYTRRALFRLVSERIENFSRCGITRVDEWADEFRLEHRTLLSRALIILSLPEDSWAQPEKQAYISNIVSFFEQKVMLSIKRGPLARMSIAKTSPRIDLMELGTERVQPEPILDRILDRSERIIDLDPAAFVENPILEKRLRNLQQRSTLYKRDTGIDGLYLGFPFVVFQPSGANVKPRIAPVLLWPISLSTAIGQRGNASIGFDHDREEVRINPALEGFIGSDEAQKWKQQAQDLLNGTVKTADVMDAFGIFSSPRGRELTKLPGLGTTVATGAGELACSAVLFHVTFMGQAVVEDLRQLKYLSPSETSLESCLRINNDSYDAEEETDQSILESEHYFTSESDPTQESAILQARKLPGLLVEGPPGTGKSQTIVNMICDSIGCNKSLLLICQKQAALEVVQKRILAEGLGNRIIMVTDAQKDRRSVLLTIREQLESLRNFNTSSDSIKSDRLIIANQIKFIETDINKHHEALHKTHKPSGLSYRDIISELVGLESGDRAPIGNRTLRSIVSEFNIAHIATIEEICAPLGALWLYSEYEDSPLGALKDFGWDSSSIDDFHIDFNNYADAERNREAVLEKHNGKIDFDDFTPAKEWVSTHENTFKTLEEKIRQNLSRWLDLFRPNKKRHVVAQKARDALAIILHDLKELDENDHDEKIFDSLVALEKESLDEWINISTKATEPVSFIGRLSINRYLCRRKLRKYLNNQSEEPTDNRMSDFLSSLILEDELRKIRLLLEKVEKSIGNDYSGIHRFSINMLHDLAINSQKELIDVALLVQIIDTSPAISPTEAAAKIGTYAAFAELFNNFEVAFARYNARSLSLVELHKLENWFNEDWVLLNRKQITDNHTNSACISEIKNKLHSLDSYQKFRVRSKLLTDDAWKVFGALRKEEEEMFKLPKADIDKEIRRTINREVRLSWKYNLEHEFPVLLLERSELENKITSLANAEAAMRKVNRKLLVNDIDTSCLDERRKWEDITRLSGPRAIRLREFIDRATDIGLMKLRPVWLMNPDVASRILPLKSGMFDTVIYDEASQMPVEFALPTLYRSKLSVVSGDEKQLPPTSFFSSKIESDEAEIYDGDLLDDDATDEERDEAEEVWNKREIKDCPDLLLLARSSLPKTMLQIHYRSKYRELIEYSNASFYGNHLNIPVQHPESKVREDKPIEVHRVNGDYEHQTNFDEAEAVVQILSEIWSKQREQIPSVGVVTFNRKQADLIEEILEVRSEADPTFRSAYVRESSRQDDGEDMGFFVKNVENVQGDERDVIIFSSTFGRNPQGTFHRRFGVLGQKGGERRLNVAVSRARNKIILATSIPVDDVSDMLSSHNKPTKPRDYLQGYLRYAQLISDGELESAHHLLRQILNNTDDMQSRQVQEEDAFGKTVAAYIRELGWNPVPANDGTAFGIDYAIKDVDTGLYGIGIECDTPKHRILSSARAREIWRPNVLSHSIPRIHRVSSHGWYHNREEEKLRLKEVISSALTQG